MHTDSTDEPAAPPHRHRFTIADTHRMIAMGVLASAGAVELIDGDIIDRAPMSPARCDLALRLAGLLASAVGTAARVVRYTAIGLDADCEPRPDVAVLRGGPGKRAGAAVAEDLLLVLEVSEAGHYDYDHKVPCYARHGVAEIWLFDLARATVHFFRAPADGQYTDEIATDRPGVIFLPGLTDTAVDLRGTLPTA